MKIFITGSTGFIGKNLIKSLKSYQFVSYKGDILDKFELWRQMKGCDMVIHLAGKFWPGSLTLPSELYEINAIGTANVVEAMNSNAIKKLIFASSVAAIEPTNNPYALSKYMSEQIILQNKGINPVILRFSNIYGKGQKDKAVSNFIKGEKTGRITIQGNGQQERDFIYIDDAVRAVFMALNMMEKGIKSITPIDICSGESSSLLELAEEIRKRLKKSFVIEFEPSRGEGLPPKANFNDALYILGFKAKISLKEGIGRILK
jgi:nucleoside-diphosphate-sugar epimerase